MPEDESRHAAAANALRRNLFDAGNPVDLADLYATIGEMPRQALMFLVMTFATQRPEELLDHLEWWLRKHANDGPGGPDRPAG